MLEDVEVTVDEVADIGVSFKIFSGECFKLVEEWMPFLSGFASCLTAMVTPTICEWYSPTGMDSGIKELAYF